MSAKLKLLRIGPGERNGVKIMRATYAGIHSDNHTTFTFKIHLWWLYSDSVLSRNLSTPINFEIEFDSEDYSAPGKALQAVGRALERAGEVGKFLEKYQFPENALPLDI